jgi:SAM-dependent methyltransferase
MKECSKSIPRRLLDTAYVSRYFTGVGIDIGGRPDPLSLYQELFPLMESVQTWDLEDGDAQYLEDVVDESFDFVHSSHCLEHLRDPEVGLNNWFRILRSGGHLVFTVPDEDLYEQGIFPSTYNKDHKWTFTLYKGRSWSAKSINLIDLIRSLGDRMEPVRLQLLDLTHRRELPRYDQTLTPVGESGIEVIIRKRGLEEVEQGGRRPQPIAPVSRELRIHLNQYRDDRQTLKQANKVIPPFCNDRDID